MGTNDNIDMKEGGVDYVRMNDKMYQGKKDGTTNKKKWCEVPRGDELGV